MRVPESADVAILRERAADAVRQVAVHRWRQFAAVGLLLVGVVVWGIARADLAPAPPPEQALPRVTTTTVVPATNTGPGEAGSTSANSANPAGTEVVVQASGAVNRPGVYRLPALSRVGDVVDAAGGATDDADLDRINLASRLTDGQRVYLVRRSEMNAPPVVGDDGAAPATPGAKRATGPIDLNAATAEQLDTLPGVGPTTAEAIVEHRTKSGPFRSTEELGEVRGIGPAKLEQLRPLVRT